MTTSTVKPEGEPETYIGDLDKISVTAQYLNADEGSYTQKLISDYCEQQSRTPASQRTYFELDDRRIDYMRQYGLRYSFHNYTNANVVVVDRLGLPVTITPERRRPEAPGTFLIRKEMYFDNSAVSHRAYHNVQSLGKLHGAELTRLMPELGREVSGHRFGRCLSLEYIITEEEIRCGDGKLYHLPTDLVLSFLTAGETIRHPCSPEYTQSYAPFIPNFPDGSLDIRVAYRYVSANIKALPKYVRVGSLVFMLLPEHKEAAKLVNMPVGKDKAMMDVEMSEYIELIYPAKQDATREGVKGFRCRRVTVAEAKDQFEVYDTLEDARHPAQVAEREKKQHKEELLTMTTKHAEQMRLTHEKLVKADDDLRLLRITNEELRRARDIEIERVKEENERSAHRRKISAENIKLLTVIATAAVTLAGLYLKYKSGKSQSS